MTALLRFARRYMLPYWLWYVGGTIALVATNWMSVTIPLLLADGVDALAEGEAGRATVAWSAMLVGLMGFAVIVVRTASRVLYFTPGRLVEARVKADLFEALMRHQPSFLQRYETGDLFSRVSSDVNLLRLLGGFGVLQLANTFIALGMAGVQMVRLSPQLAVYLLGPVSIALVVVQLFIRRMFQLMRRLQKQNAALSSQTLATYRGVATVQGFAAEEAFLDRFDTRNAEVLGTTLQQAQIRALLGPTLSFAADLNIFLLIFFGGPMAIRGELTVGELVAFTTLVGFVTGPLRASSFLLSILRNAEAALERVDELLYAPPDRPDLPSPEPAPREAPTLTVEGLTFAYPDGDDPALHDLSFQVPSGSTLGILGLTGSGKSTLLKVLSRLHNPPEGTVFVDGVDLRDVDLDDWRRALTLVPQRALLFSESLADNVLLGLDDPERLQRALDAAELAQDITALPDGVDTLVGESGVRLSGGQRQRTALARALARQHHVLLLDDVLSAVDHATEKQLLDTLRGTGGDTTTVIVAHRVSALQHADHVLVLDEGRIVDQGTHAELRARPGLYRDTCLQQQAEAT